MSQANLLSVTISERVPGSVLPSRSAELLRDVVLEDGFDVRGSVYAHNLQASGGGIVDGSVFVRREAVLSPPEPYFEDDDESRPMVFQSGVYAGVAVATELPANKKSSPVQNSTYVPLIIRGEVAASRVRLENAVVIGNVRADNAVLKDSIILGTPVISQRLQVEHCVMVSFNAGTVELIGRNTLLFPYAVSDAVPSFDTERTKAAAQPTVDSEPAPDGDETWVRYLGLCFEYGGCGGDEGPERVSMSCVRHFEGSCPYQLVRMRSSDVREVKRQDGRDAYAFTLADRLLNVSKMRRTLMTIVTILRTANYFGHYDESARELFRSDYADNTDPLISMLYRLVKPSIDRD